ncbi:MAG: PIN domain-containing protein [gamma proteobacterium symbiont of Taylorina sp.]|nr:PIN domain-containing protein [gamma proteobacterium symbiont of Taylorina sp.]
MEVLVDTSIWIDYFRSGDKSGQLDFLIDENLIVINDLILTELLPLLIVKQEKKVINLLKMVKKHPIHPDWEEIIDYQVSCLKSGSNNIGIADLLIAQNSIQNNVPVYSIDKHFKLMNDAQIGIKLYI